MTASRLTCLLLAALALAGCGPAGAPARAVVPGVDPLSGELAAVDVDLPGADLAAIRGPAGFFLTRASVEGARIAGGRRPDCSLRRLPGGAQVAVSASCRELLGAYAALDRARNFLLSAGAEALPPAPVLAEAVPLPEGAGPGLRYLAASDAFLFAGGPAGARVPAALNPGAVTQQLALRQLRALADVRKDDADGIALFLGAAASGDPAYRAASAASGDPRGELDLSRPLAAGASAADVLAGALWAWADVSGDTLGAARASIAAAAGALQAPAGADGGSGTAAVLSLVAGQLVGAERDQACAVFRARAAASIPTCP
ncbi:MAG: hypothetical protein NVSMB23_25290 [Myxococcales bacterium]